MGQLQTPLINPKYKIHFSTKRKNIASLSALKEGIVTLRDKNYKTTRAIKEIEKKIDDRVRLSSILLRSKVNGFKTVCNNQAVTDIARER